uniref:acid phosphatase n=1 Tax=Photinus pyralis TaxID=7054 RepID=A0A1Y1L018_PHOPY
MLGKTALYVSMLTFFVTVEGEINDVTTLKYVHLLFRHGHRTPLNNKTYPTDPHKDETFYPYGFGTLTNEGKRASYELGEWLQKRYKHYLGYLYYPELVEAFTTPTVRTQMTMALVLAGLFPPKGTVLEWNKNLNWQPTVYTELSRNDKLLYSPFNNNCTTYHELYKDFLRSEEGMKLLKSTFGSHNYIKKNTKWDKDPLSVIFGTMDKLVIQKELKLPLPEWANGIFPDGLTSDFLDFLQSTSGNSKLKQMTGGYLLQKILKDTNLKLTDQLPKKQKMSLYAGHDVSIFSFLSIMEVYKRHRPQYTACVIVEVHTIKNIDRIRILYKEESSSNEAKVLIVPGCEEFCPLTKFTEILKDNIFDDEICSKDKQCCRL